MQILAFDGVRMLRKVFAFGFLTFVVAASVLPARATERDRDGLEGIFVRTAPVYSAPDPTATQVGRIRQAFIVKAVEHTPDGKWVRVESYDRDRATGWARREDLRSISRAGFWWEDPALPPPEEVLMPRATLAPACPRAKRELEDLFMVSPRRCRKRTDCGGYYYRASSCAPAVVLERPGMPQAFEKELLELQTAVRSNCEPDPVACAPAPFKADCVDDRCVDRLQQPEPQSPF